MRFFLINKRRTPVVPVILVLSVLSLSFGGVGGSLQPARILTLAMLPFLIIRFMQIKEFKIKGLKFSLLVFVLTTWVYSFFSIAWTVDLVATLSYIVVLSVNIIPLLILYTLKTEEVVFLRKYIPLAWLGSGFIISVLALYEFSTGNHFYLSMQDRGGGLISSALPFAAGFHGNINDFSLYMYFCLFGSLLVDVDRDKLNNRNTILAFFVFIFIITAFSIILVNGSRAVILSVLILLLFKFIKINKFTLFIASIPVLLITFFLAKREESIFDIILLYLKLKFTDFSSDVHSEEGRLNIIQGGLTGIVDSFGLGAGAGASTSYLENYTLLVIPNPHNLVLEWGLNFGVLGCIVFFLLLFKLLVNSVFLNCNKNRFIIVAFIITLPLWGVVQSHLTGYTYFWFALFTLILFVIQNRNK